MALPGFRSRLQRNNGSSFDDIAEIKDIQAIRYSSTAIDATNIQSQDGFKEFIVGLKDSGELTFSIQIDLSNNQSAYDTLRQDLLNKIKIGYRFRFPDGNLIDYYDSIVTGLRTSVPLDNIIQADVTIKLSGRPRWGNINQVDTNDLITAFSLRQIHNPSDNIIHINRSSDGQERSFIAEELINSEALDWVGQGNEGFVASLYNQGSIVHHANQPVFASQPKIISNGQLVTGDGGKPAMLFDGVDDFLQGDPFMPNGNTLDLTIFIVAASTQTGVLRTSLSLSGSASTAGATASFTREPYVRVGGIKNFDTAFNSETYHLQTWQIPANGAVDDWKLWANGQAVPATSTGPSVNQTFDGNPATFYIGKLFDGVSGLWGGTIQEILVYQSLLIEQSSKPTLPTITTLR